MARCTITWRDSKRTDTTIHSDTGVAITTVDSGSGLVRIHYKRNGNNHDLFTPEDCIHSIEVKNENEEGDSADARDGDDSAGAAQADRIVDGDARDLGSGDPGGPNLPN